jgi:hypothetical protein
LLLLLLQLSAAATSAAVARRDISEGDALRSGEALRGEEPELEAEAESTSSRKIASRAWLAAANCSVDFTLLRCFGR